MENKKALKAVLVGLMAAPLLLISEPASAGTNGQQVEVRAGWAVDANVTVSGTNQDGRRVSATWRTDGWGNAKTDNWWWVGPVTIHVRRRSGILIAPQLASRNCSANVPKVQWSSNWVHVDCKV